MGTQFQDSSRVARSGHQRARGHGHDANRSRKPDEMACNIVEQRIDARLGKKRGESATYAAGVVEERKRELSTSAASREKKRRTQQVEGWCDSIQRESRKAPEYSGWHGYNKIVSTSRVGIQKKSFHVCVGDLSGWEIEISAD